MFRSVEYLIGTQDGVGMRVRVRVRAEECDGRRGWGGGKGRKGIVRSEISRGGGGGWGFDVVDESHRELWMGRGAGIPQAYHSIRFRTN